MSEPSVCPVCKGKGKVPPNFYDLNLSGSTSAALEICRSCDGCGYIWDTIIIQWQPPKN